MTIYLKKNRDDFVVKSKRFSFLLWVVEKEVKASLNEKIWNIDPSLDGREQKGVLP